MSFFDDTYSQSLIIVILLMMYVAFQSFIEHKKIHLLHETGFGIIIGFVLGFIMNEFNKDVSFSGEEFFQIILPPIIFAAGYNMKKKKFFSNIFYIALYAVVGTLVNFFITLFITEGAKNAGWIVDMNGSQVDLSTIDILYFSATMCASDAIAALTLINSAAYPKLFSIVFGEGLLNDAVAIILFDSVDSIVSSTGETILTGTVILELFGNFLKNCALSVLIGIATAFLATFLTKQFRFIISDPIKENIFLLLIGYGTYCLAQICDVSSVIALLTSGIIMSHYLRYNMSDYGKISTGITVSTLSQISESFLFIYLGMTSWSYITNASKVSMSFLGLSFGITCIARLGCIYGTSAIAYALKRKTWMVNRYEMSIIWFAGLIRGAVAFALIQTVEQKLNPVVVSTILFIVFFTTVGLGALMPVYVKYFTKRMSLSEKVKMKELLLQEKAKEKEKEKERKRLENSDKKSGFSLRRLDDTFLKPFLIYDYENRKEEIQQEKLKQKQAEEGIKPEEAVEEEASEASFDYGNNPVLSQIKYAKTRQFSIDPSNTQGLASKSFQHDNLQGYAPPTLDSKQQKRFQSVAVPQATTHKFGERPSINSDNEDHLMVQDNKVDVGINNNTNSNNERNNTDDNNKSNFSS